MSDLVWDAPRPSRVGKGQALKRVEILAELKARPGEWAKVSSGLGYHPGRTAKDWRAKGCEAACRKLDDGWALYVRWPS